MATKMDEWCLIDFMDLDVLANKIIEVRFEDGRKEGRLWEISYPQELYWAHPVFDRQLLRHNGLQNRQPPMQASQDVEVMDLILEGLEAAAFGDQSYYETYIGFRPGMACKWSDALQHKIQARLMEEQAIQLEVSTSKVNAPAKAVRL